jgi:hypothetical protein
MRPILQNQPQIESLSQALMQSLRALVAAIQTGWNQQHNGDGSHAAVTAASASVSGLTTLGKLRLNSVTYVHTSIVGTVNDLTVAGLADVSCLRIVTENASPLTINGIDATGRSAGDLLLVLNCDTTVSTPGDHNLALEAAASVAENRFATSSASPASPFVLQGARGVWLMYDYQTTISAIGARSPRWRIIAAE